MSDAARGAIKLIDTPAAEANVFNLGYGEDITVESLAYRIADLLGYDEVSITIDDHRVRSFDVERLHCDYSKANVVVGYEPQVTLEDGLRRTIEWDEEKGSWQWERPRESLPRGK